MAEATTPPPELSKKRPRGTPTGNTPIREEKIATSSRSRRRLGEEFTEVGAVPTKTKGWNKWTPEEESVLVEFVALFSDLLKDKVPGEWPRTRNQDYWNKAASYVNDNCHQEEPTKSRTGSKTMKSTLPVPTFLS